MKSRTTAQFRKSLARLPDEIRQQARVAYALLDNYRMALWFASGLGLILNMISYSINCKSEAIDRLPTMTTLKKLSTIGPYPS